MQFVALADSQAGWFLSSPPTPALTMPLFRDPSAAREAWRELDAQAVKHDTFVFDAAGQLVLSWKATRGVSSWRTDIAAAVRRLPP